MWRHQSLYNIRNRLVGKYYAYKTDRKYTLDTIKFSNVAKTIELYVAQRRRRVAAWRVWVRRVKGGAAVSRATLPGSSRAPPECCSAAGCGWPAPADPALQR